MAYNSDTVISCFLEVVQDNTPELSESFISFLKENKEGNLVIRDGKGEKISLSLVKAIKAILPSIVEKMEEYLQLDECNEESDAEEEEVEEEIEEEEEAEEVEEEEEEVEDVEEEEEEDEESENEEDEGEQSDEGEEIDSEVLKKINKAKGDGKVYNVKTHRIVNVPAKPKKGMKIDEKLGICGEEDDAEYERLHTLLSGAAKGSKSPEEPKKKAASNPPPKKLVLTQLEGKNGLFIIKGTMIVVEKVKEGKKFVTKGTGRVVKTAKGITIANLSKQDKKILDGYSIPYDE